MCVCGGGGGGSCRATSSLVILGHLAMALLIAQRGTVRSASQSVPYAIVAPVDTQKSSAFKTKKSVSQCSLDSVSRDFFHVKSKPELHAGMFAVLVPSVINVLTCSTSKCSHNNESEEY